MAKRKKEEIKKNNKKNFKKKNFFLIKLELIGSEFINLLDDFNDNMGDNFRFIGSRIVDFGANVIIKIDQFMETLGWFIGKVAVLLLRKAYKFRVLLHENKRSILTSGTFFLLAALVCTMIYSNKIAYEYTYNGKALGLVKEERTVTEILDLIGGELSQEYGKTVRINEKLDISFKPVVSINKPIDTMDDVLNKFSTVSDIKVVGAGIYVDNELLLVLDNEEDAKTVLTRVKDQYLNPNTKYEYIEFKEDVQIKESVTSLSNISNVERAYAFLCTNGEESSIYVVQKGDDFNKIASKCGIDVATLKELNPNLGKTISAGDRLLLKKANPLLTVLTKGTSTYEEIIPYEITTIKTNQYYLDFMYTKTPGASGAKLVVADIISENGVVVESKEISSTVVREPVTEEVWQGTKPIPPRKGTGKIVPPLKSYNISSEYGYRRHPILHTYTLHTGIDLTARRGAFIYAADGGEVTFAGDNGGLGLMVEIDHGGLFKTRYGHCNELLVEVGDLVYQGEVIATVGSTGYATGAHCHFMVIYNGEIVNPRDYVTFKK